MTTRPSIGDFMTNMDQPMPRGEKLKKPCRNLWRRVALRQNCCGHPGEPGCWRVETLAGSGSHSHENAHDHHHE